MKEFLYKYFTFDVSQWRWFRKWYGGKWSFVYFSYMQLGAWVNGDGSQFIGEVGVTILETEEWSSR